MSTIIFTVVTTTTTTTTTTTIIIIVAKRLHLSLSGKYFFAKRVVMVSARKRPEGWHGWHRTLRTGISKVGCEIC